MNKIIQKTNMAIIKAYRDFEILLNQREFYVN